jgi:hypothetical protein
VQKYSFKHWAENKVRRIADPGEMSQIFYNTMPREAEARNTGEIWDFVAKMGDNKKNKPLALLQMKGGSFPDDYRYGPKKLTAGLLNITTDKLDFAVGLISPVNEITPNKASGPQRHYGETSQSYFGRSLATLPCPMFAFVSGPPIPGALIIRHPPTFFNNEEMVLLAGTIYHELRHAIDFVHMGGTTMGMQGTGNEAVFDRDAYYRHIMESRAFSDQIRWLFKQMGGNIEAVIDALKNPRFGAGDEPEFLETAELFLKEIVKGEEAVKSGVSEDVVPLPAAQVSSIQAYNANQIAMMLAKIIKGFHFGNFMKRK